MKIAEAALSVGTPISWSADWAWSLPLIILTLLVHVVGLLLIAEIAKRFLNGVTQGHSYPVVFTGIVGGTSLSVTLLLAIDGMIWAVAYLLVGALPDTNSAVLYSLSALTAYGHANLDLERRWQLMGAMEALNGMLLFGLTTAFLFGTLQKTWELRGRRATSRRAA